MFGGVGGPDGVMMGMPGMAMANAAVRRIQPEALPDITPVAPKDLAPVQRTRKLFPETWIWKSEKIP
jgi:hypothetical protein